MSKPTLNIQYLSNAPIPSQKANSIHVMKMCEAFAEIGHEVTLICRHGKYNRDHSVFEFYGVAENFVLRYLKWPRIPGAGLLYSLQVAKHLAKYRRKLDLAYARCPYSALAARILGVPVIYEAHALPRTSFHQKLEALILKYEHSRSLTVISQALKRDYCHLFPWLSEDKIVVAHDGASIDKSKELRHIDVAREERLKIVYTGSLLPGKGIDLIITIAQQLSQCDFHIIGGPTKIWESYCLAYDLPENINYHGFLHPSSVGEWQRTADILLLPNQHNILTDKGRVDIGKWTSPLKLFEYMASGAPIIASNLPVLLEVLRDGENALCVEPNSPEAWVNAIKRIDDNPSLATKISRQAYEDLVNEYTWKQRAAKVLTCTNNK